jgi:hypothetical protein
MMTPRARSSAAAASLSLMSSVSSEARDGAFLAVDQEQPAGDGAACRDPASPVERRLGKADFVLGCQAVIIGDQQSREQRLVVQPKLDAAEAAKDIGTQRL